SAGDSQSGSSASVRPSPSSSTPFEQAGCAAVVVGPVVVDGAVVSVLSGSSGPPEPTPRAPTKPKLAPGRDNAGVSLMRPRGYTHRHRSRIACRLSPCATGPPKLLARTGVRNDSSLPPTSP